MSISMGCTMQDLPSHIALPPAFLSVQHIVVPVAGQHKLLPGRLCIAFEGPHV